MSQRRTGDTTMTTYTITNKTSSADLGSYDAADADEAHDMLARDAGYEGVTDMAKRLGRTWESLRAELEIRAE